MDAKAEIPENMIETAKVSTFDSEIFEETKDNSKRMFPKKEARMDQPNHHFRMMMDALFTNPEKILMYICQNMSSQSSKDYQQVSIATGLPILTAIKRFRSNSL